MRRLGITAQLVIHSASVLTALGAAVTLYSVSQLRTLLYREMVQRVEAQTLNWIEANTAQIILSGDPRTLDRLVNELKTRKDIAYVILLDAQQRQKAAAAPQPGLHEVQADARDPAKWRDMRDDRGRLYFELTAPISAAGTGMSPDLGTLFGAAAQDPTWGALRVGVDRQAFDLGVNALVRKNISLAAALIALSIALCFVFARRMVAPITRMGKAADQIAAGNLSQRVLSGRHLRDEIGDLVRNFNHMALRLEENCKEMQALQGRLEETVRERTHELVEANRKLKELDQLKSDFISTVSHELRTPLTSIKAYGEILLDSPQLDPAARKHFLDIIDKEANRMSRLIADLLNVRKIESGTICWAMRSCELREIIMAAAAVLAPSAKEKDISLRLHIPEPQTVWADADRIQEVITNLVANGIKFCPYRGHIEIRMRRADASGPGGSPGEFALIEITDDGPGIDHGEQGHVFEKFFQGTRNGAEGSGLGLAISREIVLRHEGQIWLESSPGAGSSFYFTLPVRPPRRAMLVRAPAAKTEV